MTEPRAGWDTQLSVPCVKCGQPAPAHGEHHARDTNLNMGKGMGGAEEHEHLLDIPFCRGCHRGAHEKRFTAVLLVQCLEPDTGQQLSIRAIEPREEGLEPEPPQDYGSLRELLTVYTDEALAYYWELCQQHGGQVYVHECVIADAVHERYAGYGGKWAEQAGQTLESSPDTVLRRFHAWAYLMTVDEPEADLALLGKSVVESLGRRALAGRDVKGVADTIAAARKTGDMTAGEAVALIQQEKALEWVPPSKHECPLCKALHRIQE